MAPHASSLGEPSSPRWSVQSPSASTDCDGTVEDAIAVVGHSFVFPGGATDSASFWKILLEGRNVTHTFPEDRFQASSVYHPDNARNTSINVSTGSFISEDITAFDAPFFSISAEEAASMDPQQRILLESTYKAFENAGIPMSKVSGSKTSVFIGSFNDDYRLMYFRDPQEPAKYAATGITRTLNANRISWFFDTRGTSVNVDTACSSSLIALDMACENLRSGDCSMSVVGGCNIILTPDLFFPLSLMNFLSPEGRCRSFDSRANGYGRGEGVGIVVLKKLTQAIADGDTIRAVIRATGSSQDGFTPGITQPSGLAQERLIRECYEKANLNPLRTRYFEAHGTGTVIGDPIEADALGAVFRAKRSVGDPLYIGSVKSNIGHLEATSGIAGLIKSVMILESGVIPAVADLKTLNPRIDAEHLRLQFPNTAVPWPKAGLRRLSINSFGFGGSNSHAIMDDAYHFLKENSLRGITSTRQTPPSLEDIAKAPPSLTLPAYIDDDAEMDKFVLSAQNKSYLLPISAPDEEGVQRVARNVRVWLKALLSTGDAYRRCLDAVSYTLAKRRTSFTWRSFATIDRASTPDQLDIKFAAAQRSTAISRLAFVFSGQGAQWPEMGKDLMQFDAFRRSLEEAEVYLISLGCAWRLIEELCKPEGLSRVSTPELSQPLCTAIQLALVDLLESWRIYPCAVIGHSSGEIAAAYASGALSSQSALRIAYFRGLYTSQLYQDPTTVRGAMLSAGVESEKVPALLREAFPDGTTLTIACYNSPKSVTISGDEHEIDVLCSSLQSSGIFARKLLTGAAYHSHHMQPLVDRYQDSIGSIEARGQQRDAVMISSVSAGLVEHARLQENSYWTANLVSPVKFEQGFEQLCKRWSYKKLDGSHRSSLNIDACVEIGPHGVLKGPMREILAKQSRTLPSLSALWRKSSGVQTALGLAGDLWSLGCPIDIHRVNCPVEKSNTFVSIPEMPAYEFDHSKKYLHEGRISRMQRMDAHPKNDLVGNRAIDWNPLEARWSNLVKVSDLPWVKDHAVNDSILYPAAGMLVMAIEAMNQLQQDKTNLIGFEISEVTFHTALTIPRDERGIEIQFYIHTSKDASVQGQPWSDFKLCTHVNGTWDEICHGRIRPDYRKPVPESKAMFTADNTLSDLVQLKASIMETQGSSADMSKIYEDLREGGLDFGPAFQSITAAYLQDQHIVADIEVHDRQKEEQTFGAQESIVHPCTLDGVFQSSIVYSTGGGIRKIPAHVITGLKRAWISSEGLKRPEEEHVVALTEVLERGNKKLSADSWVFGRDQSKALMEIEALTSVAVDQSLQLEDEDSAEHNLWNLQWRPDIDMLTTRQIQDLCDKLPASAASEPVEFYTRLTFLHYASLVQMLLDVSENEIGTELFQLPLYYKWAKKHVQRFETQSGLYWDPKWKQLALDPEHVQTEATWVKEQNAEGRCSYAIYENLKDILRSKVDALELLFQSPLLADLYADTSARTMCFRSLDGYLQLFSHKNPTLRYLEIGAGTGGSTVQILKSLVNGDDPLEDSTLYTQYTFTDISEAFFDAAKTKFGSYPKMDYRKLDIEKDLSDQSFEVGSYDVIVAANVLHATHDIQATMRNVHKLLAPGGKLILFEITTPDLGRSGFVVGLLAGWWLSTEPYRPQGPCMSVQTWDDVLKKTGFSGVDQVFQDYKNDVCHEFSIMVTTKQADLVPVRQTRVAVVSGDASFESQKTSHVLQEHLQSHGYDVVSRTDAENQTKSNGQSVLMINDLHSPYLENLDDAKLSHLQQLMAKSESVIWLTQATGEGSCRPDFGLADGLSRTYNTETESSKVTMIGLDFEKEFQSAQLDGIVKILSQNQIARKDRESAYEERQGVFHLCRLNNDKECQTAMGLNTNTNVPRETTWGEAPALEMTVETLGALDSLSFVQDDTFDAPLGQDEVEIKVHAVGLNFRDCLIALGTVPNEGFGKECAGVITRVGSSNLNILKPGDRVCMITKYAFKTFARSKATLVHRIPDSISLVEAAAIPGQFFTAWTCLHDIARLGKGQSILVHAGAGGTGQAAIQVSQYLGAEVYATVGSEAKRDLLEPEYSIPRDRIFYSRDNDFKDQILKVTKGRGVDVILNSLSDELLEASWECLAPFGRFIEIGKKDILANKKLSLLPFDKGLSFTAFDASMFVTERSEQVQQCLETVFGLIQARKLHAPCPLNVHSVTDVSQAFRELADGKTVGKAVIEIKEDAVVKAKFERPSSWHFSEDASYVIAGGFGGIGRSIARWMVDRGVRNLIILSRSGPKTQLALDLVDELRQKGAVVRTPKCNLIDRESLRQCLSVDCGDLPPIRGCVQAAMVLQDGAFDEMDVAQWNQAVEPKRTGSWNLHTLLPSKMDFFVQLSSASGLTGLHGQANYAAGNTYQDALSRYRVRRGEKSIAINLGAMVDDGYLAENQAVLHRILQTGVLSPITRDDFFALLQYYCDPSLPVLSPERSQVVVGIRVPQAGGTGSNSADDTEGPGWVHRPMYRKLYCVASRSRGGGAGGDAKEDSGAKNTAQELRATFAAAATLSEAANVAALAIFDKLSRTLSNLAEVTAPDMRKPLMSFGLDSLLAIEVRTWLFRTFQADIPMFEILGGTDLATIGVKVASKSTLRAQVEG